LASHIGQIGSAMFQDRPSKISHETWYSTGDWQAGQQAIRFAVSAESRNLIIAAWNDSGVGKVWPLFGGISDCTRDRRPEWGPAEGCV